MRKYFIALAALLLVVGAAGQEVNFQKGGISATGTVAGNLTVSGTATITGTTTLNGQVACGDGGDTAAVNSSDWDISATGVCTGFGAITADGALTLDDGSGASPDFAMTDETNESATFSKVDAGFLTVTTVAGDGVQITTGNLKVGNGVPTGAQNGEDFYCEGTAEFDSTVAVEGLLTAKADLTVGDNAAGNKVLAFDEDTADATVTWSGAVLTVAGATTFSNAVTLSSTVSTGGAGTAAAAGNVATENAMGTFHTTLLTMTNVAMSAVDTDGGAGGVAYGNVKLYDFPEGALYIISTVVNLTSILSAGTATAAAWDGDFAIGTAADANGALAGAEVSLLASTATIQAVAQDAINSDAVSTSTEHAVQDGTGTAKDLYLNLIIDDVDFTDGLTETFQVDGTVQITWIAMGDI